MLMTVFQGMTVHACAETNRKDVFSAESASPPSKPMSPLAWDSLNFWGRQAEQHESECPVVELACVVPGFVNGGTL
jgi:hypothetical protein